jgi:hypothetical protein
MSTKSKWINGAICFVEKGNEQRMHDAFGLGVHKYLNEFTSLPVDDTTGDPTEWTNTIVEAGTGDSTVYIDIDHQGGWLRINAAANENDGYNMQLTGESFKLTSGDFIYFNTQFLIDEATQSDFMIGLCIGGSTTALGGVTDGVYFRTVDGSAAMTFVTEKDSTETSTAAATLAAATTYYLSFVCDGTGTVHGYVNGTLVATHTTNIPDDEALTVTIAYLNGAATMQNYGAEIDYVKVIGIMN